jgi:hypothetical protein
MIFFCVDPDPRIHASEKWIRIRILLFSSLPGNLQDANKKLSEKKQKNFSAYYFLKVHLHHFSKIKSPKEVTRQ